MSSVSHVKARLFPFGANASSAAGKFDSLSSAVLVYLIAFFPILFGGKVVSEELVNFIWLLWDLRG